MSTAIISSTLRLGMMILMLIASVTVVVPRLHGQHDAPSLAGLVERHFFAETETDAHRVLDKILALRPAGDSLLHLLRRRPKTLATTSEFRLAHETSILLVRIKVPQGHTFESPPLPVVFNPASNGRQWHLLPDDLAAIRVAIPDFRPAPDQFSDLGRDAYLRVLRIAAWMANGDMDRLWMTGFSWAAHACCDTALHRPGVLRGILPMGGGPRRRHFRLAPNLAGLSILTRCGEKDDPELIWNLREFDRIQKKNRFDHRLVLDPTRGHRTDLAGAELTKPTVEGEGRTTSRPTWPKKGTLLADMARVENRWLRIDAVDEKRVRVPSRIPVSARLSPDKQRRATIAAMRKAVARLDWKWSTSKRGVTTLTLKSRGVREATVMIRRSMVAPRASLVIRAGKTRLGPTEIDVAPATLLRKARRTGNRLDPVVAGFVVRF